MSSSVHANNKTKKILVLGEGITQGLDYKILTAGKKYLINFTENKNKFCLSLHYNGANCYLFVNGIEIIKFKAKVSEILKYPLCLGNISKNVSVNNMLDTRLYGWVYDFSVDYDLLQLMIY